MRCGFRRNAITLTWWEHEPLLDRNVNAIPRSLQKKRLVRAGTWDGGGLRVDFRGSRSEGCRRLTWAQCSPIRITRVARWMATIVLVHGIDNQREWPNLIESGLAARWRGACGRRAGGDLATGRGPRVRGPTPSSAGRRITPARSAARPMGHRGHLRDWTEEQTTLAEALALEYPNESPGGPAEDADAAQARLDAPNRPRPGKSPALGAQPLAPSPQDPLPDFLGREHGDVRHRDHSDVHGPVTHYLTDSDTGPCERDEIDSIDAATRVVINHSLESAAAYEVRSPKLSNPLPLLVTIGSPPGLPTIVTQRLSPPPLFPRGWPPGSTSRTAKT